MPCAMSLQSIDSAFGANMMDDEESIDESQAFERFIEDLFKMNDWHISVDTPIIPDEFTKIHW